MPCLRWCARETPEVTDSYRGTVRCDMYDSPERKKGGCLMPLFMMKQRIMATGCVISFSAPFIIISPTTFREKLTRGHQPPNHSREHHTEIYLWPISAVRSADGLWINSHRLKVGGVWKKSDVRWKKCWGVCTCVSESFTCRAAAILCTNWHLTGCIQEHTHINIHTNAKYTRKRSCCTQWWS